MEYYLFDDRGYVKAYDDTNNEWYNVCASGSASEQDFLDHGETDLNIIPDAKLHELSADVQVLIYTDDTTAEEMQLTIDGEYNFLYDLNDPQLMTWTSDVSSTEKNTTTVYVPKPQVVLPTGDIDISEVHTIQSVNLVANQAGGGIVKSIVSVDGGTTWNGWDGSQWVELADTNPETVKNNGMNPDDINNITSADWEALRNGSATIRFGYYLEIVDASTDVAETDQLEMVVDVYGEWGQVSEGVDYNATYDDATDTVTIDLLSSGNFKVNY